MTGFPVRVGGGDGSSPQVMRLWSDPQVVVGTIASQARGAIAYRTDLRTGSTVTIDLSTCGSNELEMPYYIDTDDHFHTGVGVDDQDKMHVVGNHHDNNTDGIRPAPHAGMHYLVCNDTSAAGFTNAANWSVGAEPGPTLDNSADGATYTYTYFDRLTDGTLLMVHSQSYQRGVSVGRCICGWRKKAGAAWAPWGGGATPSARILYTDHGATFDVDANRAYCQGLLIIPRPTFDWVVLSGMWRTRDGDGDSQQRMTVIYCKSTDFTQWFDMAGNTYNYTTSYGGTFPFAPTNYGTSTREMPLTWFNHSAALINGQPPISGQGVLTLTSNPSTASDSVPGNILIRMFNGDSLGGNLKAGTSLPTDQWLWYQWNGSTWVQSTAPNFAGAGRDLYVGGVLYGRDNAGTPRRVNLRNTVTNKIHSQGMAISMTAANAGIVYGVGPCPIWLREGRFVGCVPVDNTPKIYQFPSGAIG